MSFLDPYIEYWEKGERGKRPGRLERRLGVGEEDQQNLDFTKVLLGIKVRGRCVSLMGVKA